MELCTNRKLFSVKLHEKMAILFYNILPFAQFRGNAGFLVVGVFFGVGEATQLQIWNFHILRSNLIIKVKFQNLKNVISFLKIKEYLFAEIGTIF